MESKNEWAKEDVSAQDIVTITVAECGEFKSLGKIYEGITKVDDALHIFLRLLQQRRMGFPSISIHVQKGNNGNMKDASYEIFSGNMVDLTALQFFPEITCSSTALKMISEIVAKIPKRFEIRGEIDAAMK